MTICLQMKALQGIKNSYRLQQVLQRNNPLEPIRGFRVGAEGQCAAHNGFLYSVLRSNRSHRRGLLTSLLNLFDDTGVRLSYPAWCNVLRMRNTSVGWGVG